MAQSSPYILVYWTQNLTYLLVFVPFDFDLKVRETTFCHEFLRGGDKDRIVGEELWRIISQKVLLMLLMANILYQARMITAF